MTVIVITKFKDKYTKVWHMPNEELNVDSKRYEEIKKFVKLKKQKNKNKQDYNKLNEDLEKLRQTHYLSMNINIKSSMSKM